jgi:hypothetical protein
MQTKTTAERMPAHDAALLKVGGSCSQKTGRKFSASNEISKNPAGRVAAERYGTWWDAGDFWINC